MRPVTLNTSNIVECIREIERASHENDTGEIAQAFTVDDPAFTPVFQLNTTAPSLANIANFLATFLTTLQKGGVNRTT